MLFRRVRTSASTLLVLSLAATMLLALAAPARAGTFRDTSGKFYDGAVQALFDAGAIKGCEDGLFCPDQRVTRGQIASMLVQALKLPASQNDHFRDDTDNPHEANINALAEAGLTDGCGDGTYCPHEHIKREQVASMLDEAFDPPATTTVHFDDRRNMHSGAIDRLTSDGIVAGCRDPLTSFCPGDPLLRSHVALFLARAMDLSPRVKIASLAERRKQQAAIDAERERLRQEQLAAQRQAERYAIWDRLAQCESGGNWHINTGNGYYGGLQFSLSSWRAVGGSGYPHKHSREQQIYRAEKLLKLQGWGAWPACSSKLGYR